LRQILDTNMSSSAAPSATRGSTYSTDTLVESARRVVNIEAQAIHSLEPSIDASFVAACRIMLACHGRVVVSGMGKSGHIARKIAATLASTGTPAFFVHPGEASHGDLGMITHDDVLLALSNSGETTELLMILPFIKRQGIPLLAMTGRKQSSLARQSDVHVDVSVPAEACPLGLAPTASTTAALVMGDALAVSLVKLRGFSSKDFARIHPGGALGKRLYLRVADLFVNNQVPKVKVGETMQNVIIEISSKRLGATAVLDNGSLVGIITDGDLRRAFQIHKNMHELKARDIMTKNPRCIDEKSMVVDALNLMRENNITQLPVLRKEKYVGVIHLHDILKEGII